MPKSYKEPRAVLALPPGTDCDLLTQALEFAGIEAYRALDPEMAPGMATRIDTLLVILEASSLSKTLERLGTIRAKEASREVLLAVLVDPEDLAASQDLQQAGANAVESLPLTLAKALRLIWKMSRKSTMVERPAGTSEEEAPQAILRQQLERHQGRHKVHIGAAPGVGKTYAMLKEAHDLRARGVDVVVGVVETHGRSETAQLIEGLELVPYQHIDYKGTVLREMDLEGILRRRPAIALIDELAHTNVPGSLNTKRYEDVQILRVAGISVHSTLNIQHIESLNHVVERLTGVKVRETVPDTVLEEADELVLVDISPEALQERLSAGKIYAPEKIAQSLGNFFTTHNLNVLRELVLRELADKVDERLEAVRSDIGKAKQPTGIQERILVCLTPTLASQRLLRRGARLADRLGAELLVVSVETEPLPANEEKALQQNISLAETLEASVTRLQSPSVAPAIARFAQEHLVTAIVLGESRRSRLLSLFGPSLLDALLHATQNIDVIIVATQE